MRALGVAALLTAVAAIAYLVGAERPEPPVSRSSPVDSRVDELLRRLVALEEHVRGLEARLVVATPAPAEAPAADAPTPADTPPAAQPPAPEEKKRAAERMRSEWLRRVLDAPSGPRRLAALRDGHAQLKQHAGPQAVLEYYQDVLDAVPAGSEEGMEATLQLGHIARAAKGYRQAEELYRRVEAMAPAGSARYAEAVFQLAWNRQFQGDAEGARMEFERALAAPEIEPGTAAAARYAVAGLKRDAGDLEGAKAELQRLVDSTRDHPGHGGVQYYARLAKQRLAE